MYKIVTKLYQILIQLRYRNTSFGDNVFFDLKTTFDIKKGFLKIGNNVRLRSNKNGYHAAMPFSTKIMIDVNDANIIIGDNSRLNGVFLHAQKKIIIGKNCVIASGVNIIDSNGHILKSENRTIGRDIPKEIIIEDNVWIGLNSIILKNTVIGKNSVVGAGSVVKGKFPENSIISGNPAIVTGTINFKENETSNS